MQRLSLFLAALWWGGITALSFMAVPLLFARLGAPVAGPVAAQLFSLQSWAGIFIGLAMLLVLRLQRPGGGADPDVSRVLLNSPVLGTMGFVLLAMLLAMLQEFGVAQKIVNARATGGDLRFWHAMGSAMVLGQWLCAGALLWRVGQVSRDPASPA
ncbi:DUF4149 domain-containing protein [Hydrogenophaga sp.]|uniref:DUF4149 domain-containing protein n=1 Tax=Hydrogenophaga sp. TaxID=1904254 RepID=UPI00271D7E3C|nr:DUF4149 domain-containing protein [Hydrogenophaga sp.]MDO8905860.1 DUF4149 domain-containing protein [Hydrogenophaga sp.]